MFDLRLSTLHGVNWGSSLFPGRLSEFIIITLYLLAQPLGQFHLAYQSQREQSDQPNNQAHPPKARAGVVL